MMKPMLLSLQTAPAKEFARIENGVPVRRFRKDIIRTGSFVKASDDLNFDVSTDTLDHWVAQFSQWTANGNKVPVPVTHKAAGNPKDNAGWVVDMYREDDRLVGVFDLVGEDASKLALASDVSIFVPPTHTDGSGHKYTRPITHVALCTDPVIPGLGKFEAIAASHLSLASDEDGEWITVSGRHIFIPDGEDKDEIVKGYIAKNKGGGGKTKDSKVDAAEVSELNPRELRAGEKAGNWAEKFDKTKSESWKVGWIKNREWETGRVNGKYRKYVSKSSIKFLDKAICTWYGYKYAAEDEKEATRKKTPSYMNRRGESSRIQDMGPGGLSQGKLNLSQEQDMDKIAKALGVDPESEDIEAACLAAISKLVDEKKEAENETAELSQAKKELELSMQPKTPDPLLVKLASENRAMKLDALVAAARITPAVKDDLTKQFVATEALSLSLSKGGDGFDDLVVALAKNDPVVLGEVSRAQVKAVALSRQDTKTNVLEADADRRAEAVKKN